MRNLTLLKKFLLPGVISIAATPISLKPKEEEMETKKLVRPSELPIYPLEKKKVPVMDSLEEDSPLDELVGTVRRELCSLVKEINTYSNKAASVVQENWEASNEILDYLKEEENILPRSGAIALSGLTGYVLGLRGGFFKRLIYMSLGAGGMSALCYPREAEEFFEEGLILGQKYALIGHHLATSMLDDLLGSSSSDETPKKEDSKKSS